MSDDEIICPCDVVVHPRVIWNPPGLDEIAYRVGDFTTFREALLRPRPGEQALGDWQPNTEGDLTAQLLEWWAYLADVLVFYNEAALREVLLRTAVFPDDVRRIIRLLGYRPRPGIGATGLVAAILDAPRPFTIPEGFAIQASLPGKLPQVFEVDEDVEAGLLGKPLRVSARFPVLTREGVTSQWTGYPKRDSEGKLPNRTPARAKKETKMPVVAAGTPVRVGIPGTLSNVAENDVLLFLKHDWNGDALATLPGRALAVVSALEMATDDAGLPVTVLTLIPGQTLPFGANLADYRLLKSTKYAHLWLYHERYPGSKTPSPAGTALQIAEQIFDPGGLFSGGISREPPQDPHALTSIEMFVPTVTGAAHLEAIVRGIKPGDPVMFEQKVAFPGGLPQLFAQMVGAGPLLDGLTKQLEEKLAFVVKVTGYSESIWYANPPEMDRIGQGPPIGPPSHGLISGGAAPIPIPHSKITFDDPFLRASMMSMDDLAIKTIVVHYAWEQVGEIQPVPTTDATTTPEVPGSSFVPPDVTLPVVIEDSTGAGAPGWTGVTNSTESTPPLFGALTALTNLLPVSRGQTVIGEVLGSGSSILVNQEFALQQLPLTYLTDNGPRSTNGYRSTLRVRVDGIEWHEVPSFFEQPADARVFVTREDDRQRTFVRFGDGEFGARLPTGVGNVIASYRHGSGAEVPPIATLTSVLKPLQGLQSIRNPIQPGGGADPDPPQLIRRYAPRSVLAFGRAISGDDYETIAAQTPGVRRAKVKWGWDSAAQRSMVKVFVGDDNAAVVAAREALHKAVDPNRPVLVALASPIPIDVSLTLELDPDYDADMVRAAVAAALLDPESHPFGLDVVRIDEVLYDSEIYDACLKVAGVIAVHGLQIRTQNTTGVSPIRATLPTPGFRKQYDLWNTIPKLQLLSVSRLPLAPTPIQIQVTRPLSQPLPTSILRRVAEATAQWNDLVVRTQPGTPATQPAEIWDLDSAERHAPGEGRFYLLQGDRLHIATEVWRHGR